jgi:dephospho-CoA kinase
MLVIGLTGGIASGKSTITHALQHEPGIAIVDADHIAWETYRPNTAVYKKLVEHFGKRILNPDETINRRALGTLVFGDERERKFVNQTIHPAVMARLTELARSYEAQGVEVLIVEAALLLESETVNRELFDYYVFVRVDPQEQIRRVMERDGISHEEAERKISSQAPQEEKMPRADFVLESSGALPETIAQAKALLARLRLRARKP